MAPRASAQTPPCNTCSRATSPYPAVVVNRWWELVDANAVIDIFTRAAAPELLQPPVNVLRLSLHRTRQRPQP